MSCVAADESVDEVSERLLTQQAEQEVSPLPVREPAAAPQTPARGSFSRSGTDAPLRSALKRTVQRRRRGRTVPARARAGSRSLASSRDSSPAGLRVDVHLEDGSPHVRRRRSGSEDSVSSGRVRSSSPYSHQSVSPVRRTLSGVRWASPRSMHQHVQITPASHPQRQGQYGPLLRRRRDSDPMYDYLEGEDPPDCEDLHVERLSEEPLLGALWFGNSTVLREVRGGGPLDRAGGDRFVGRLVIRVNGCRVDTADEVSAAAHGQPVVLLRFNPKYVPLAAQFTCADDQHAYPAEILVSGKWRRCEVLSVTEDGYKVAIDRHPEAAHTELLSFEAANVVLRRPRVHSRNARRRAASRTIKEQPQEPPRRQQQAPPRRGLLSRIIRGSFACCLGDNGSPTAAAARSRLKRGRVEAAGPRKQSTALLELEDCKDGPAEGPCAGVREGLRVPGRSAGGNTCTSVSL